MITAAPTSHSLLVTALQAVLSKDVYVFSLGFGISVWLEADNGILLLNTDLLAGGGRWSWTLLICQKQ